jgi:mannose-6-phosphate isomerase-like protein (cupin superfamily)
MERVDLSDLEGVSPPDENVPAGALASSIGDVRQLAPKLGIEGFSLNHFELAPGQSPAHSMHKHAEQEEVFYVLDGEITVERPDDQPDVTLEADEAVRVPPDTYQFVVNRSDEPARFLALGAPREYQAEGTYLIHCETSDDLTKQSFELQTGDDGDPEAIVCDCRECGETAHRIPV